MEKKIIPDRGWFYCHACKIFVELSKSKEHNLDPTHRNKLTDYVK